MKKFLIIEDNPINLLVFRKILTKMAGLVVQHSEDVSEVIQITQSGGLSRTYGGNSDISDSFLENIFLLSLLSKEYRNDNLSLSPYVLESPKLKPSIFDIIMDKCTKLNVLWG